MDRGPRFPHTRARWQWTAQAAGQYCMPTWIKIATGWFTYQDPVSPITTLFVFPFHMEPARWSYQQHDGLVFYESTWADGHYDGRWGFGMRSDATRRAFTITYITLPVGDPTTGKFIMTSGDSIVNLTPSNESLPPLYNLNIIQQDVPWSTRNAGQYQALTYKEIRDLGHDDRDTSPLSWNGTFSP